MAAIELTKENVVKACEDLNKVLDLSPPIVVVFETKARGASKAAAEKKFLDQMIAEIKEVADGKDEATNKFDLQEGDIPLLKPETVQIVFEISTTAAGRLGGDGKAKKAPAKKPGKAETTTKEKAPKKEKVVKEKAVSKTRTDSFVAVVNKVKSSMTVEAFIKAVNDDYIAAGGKDNLKQSKHLVGVLMPCATGFSKITVADGKVSPCK